MQALLKQAWWALLIGGLASVLFGVLAFLWPGLTLFILAVFFAATVFVDGVVTMASAIKNRATASHWWLWLLLGLLGVVAGAIGLLSPATAAGALLLLISAYAIVTGVLMIWAGFKLRTEIEREWLLWLLGAVSVLFGLLLIAQPAAGLLGFVWVIATWAVAEGILKILLAFKARRFGAKLTEAGRAANA
jgi:uncharacterized membrane protein HdeD (DUF308 family)